MFNQFWQQLWLKHSARRWRLLPLYPLALWRAYSDEQLGDNARALVYMTLLTLVPLLAVAFALLRGFGVEGVIEPWLVNLFAPMGEAGEQVVAYLLRFVNQARAGSLGVVGVVFLFVSVMGLARAIESALNRIWAVADERAWPVRIAAYLSAVLLAPLLLAALMSTIFGMQQAAWLKPFVHVPAIAAIVDVLSGLAPTLITFAVLATVYWWIPNCRVRWLAALCGAAFFLLLWYPVSWLFATFIATSAQYSAIYSGLAGIVILLFWLNFLWMLFLCGAKVAMLVQRPQALSPFAEEGWRGDEAFATAVAVMRAIFAAFRRGETALGAEALAKNIGSTPQKTLQVLAALKAAGLVLKASEQQPPRYLPAKAAQYYTLRDIYLALAPAESAIALQDDNPYRDVREAYWQMLDTPLFKE